MCGRYTVYETDKLAERFEVRTDQGSDELKPRYNAAPGQSLPVITRGDEGRSLDIMRWGLIPFWAKEPNVGYRMINARSESVFDKPTWKRPVLNSRCLVPSNGFYEWQRTDEGKQPFFIHPKDQALYAYAGLFDTWTDKETGEVIESFSILTTGPNKQMQDIHDRMPVMLEPDDEARWLDPSNSTPQSLQDMLAPYKDGQLEIYPVSQTVNNARHEGHELIEPLEDR